MPGGQGEMDTEWWWGGWGVWGGGGVSAAVQLYWLRLTSSVTPDVAVEGERERRRMHVCCTCVHGVGRPGVVGRGGESIVTFLIWWVEEVS